MKLLTLEQTPDRFGGNVYRTSPLAAIIMLIVVGALAVAASGAWYRGRIPLWALLPIGLILLLLGLMLSTVVMRAFAPTNWLMVLAPEQILLKYRSYLNADMPETDPQIIALALDEIRSVRKTRRTRNHHAFAQSSNCQPSTPSSISHSKTPSRSRSSMRKPTRRRTPGKIRPQDAIRLDQQQIRRLSRLRTRSEYPPHRLQRNPPLHRARPAMVPLAENRRIAPQQGKSRLHP